MLINVVSISLAMFVVVFSINLFYQQEEERLARDKLFFYWNYLQFSPNNINYIPILWANDVTQTQHMYGLRIVDIEVQQERYTLYPDEWESFSLVNADYSDIDYASEGGSGGNKLYRRTNNQRTYTGVTVHSLSTGSHIIQVLISTIERDSFIKNVRRQSALTFLFVIVLSFVMSVLSISRIMRPIHTINTLIERINTRKTISERLSITKKGEFERLQRNMNTMLDVIETQVHNQKHVAIQIGHDIRTPLTYLRNNIEQSISALDSSDESSAPRKRLEESITTIEEIQRFAKEVLEQVEIEAGNIIRPVQPSSIKAAVDDIYDIFEYSAEDKRIQLVTHCPEDFFVWIDPTRLRQIVSNIIDNSIKYTPQKGQITCTVSIQEKEFVTICITDTGIGIAQENIPDLFLPIWKRSKKHRGHGLGIVGSLVKAYGGKISVNTRDEGGTEVVISLPVNPHIETENVSG